MIKFVVENERFSMIVGKKAIFYFFFYFFCDKSPLEVVRVRHFNSKIVLGVRYTPCDHEGLKIIFSKCIPHAKYFIYIVYITFYVKLLYLWRHHKYWDTWKRGRIIKELNPTMYIPLQPILFSLFSELLRFWEIYKEVIANMCTSCFVTLR